MTAHKIIDMLMAELERKSPTSPVLAQARIMTDALFAEPQSGEPTADAGPEPSPVLSLAVQVEYRHGR